MQPALININYLSQNTNPKSSLTQGMIIVGKSEGEARIDKEFNRQRRSLGESALEDSSRIKNERSSYEHLSQIHSLL